MISIFSYSCIMMLLLGLVCCPMFCLLEAQEQASFNLNHILSAQTRIQEYLEPTPLIRCEALEKELQFDGKIFLKMESAQPTGSFKVRGAFNAISQLNQAERERGVITRSSGNFAQAVAYAAQKLGIHAVIVMPQNAPQTKIKGTQRYGAQIVFSGNSHEEGDAIVARLAEEQGYVRLHPYNNYQTMAGQGTAALEILQECREIHHFFCPIGGGGLLSGCATAFKESDATINIHGVEPTGAADYATSRQTGKREHWNDIHTIADGLRAAAVGELNYPILNHYVDDVHVVSDEEIKKAMKWLYNQMEIITEPSGSVSLAGFLAQHKQIQGNVVILISGKNVDQASFEQWLKEVE